MSSRPIAWLALAALLSLLPTGTRCLGKPDWAKPHLSLPSPSGGYIARSDEWAIVYGEVEFGLAGGCIEERHRYILENRTDRALAFSAAMTYDASLEALRDTALNVERTVLWHEIDLEKSALQGTMKNASKILFVGAEDIPARHRVVWEYVLTSLYPFPPWRRAFIPQARPAGQLVFKLASGSAEAGLTLEVVSPGGATLPPSFSRGEGGAWTVKDIPAAAHLEDQIILQPDPFDLYPYLLVTSEKDPASGWPGFAQKYRKEWKARESQIDQAAVSARAASLTAGLATPLQKALALTRFVQADVLYDDNNEKGLDGWFPLTPQDALRSMKADCKGKVMLLQALLAAAGMESAPVIVRRSERYFSWGDSPAKSPANHVILAVHLQDGRAGLPATLLEGPAKGWVLCDPTIESVGFGAPPPGLEGLPALFVGDGGDGRFDIHTQVPSSERTAVRIEARLDPNMGMMCTLKARDNGGAPLIASLGHTFDPEKQKREALSQLSEAVPQPNITRLQLDRPSKDRPEETALLLEYQTARAIEAMANTELLANPMAAAAVLKGIPNGLPPKRTVPPEDKVEFAPPWNLRLNTSGLASALDVQLKIVLPPGKRWTPPGPGEENCPWVEYRCSWKRNGEDTWEAEVHLAVNRGAWAPSQRKEALESLDRIFMGLYQPLVLEKVP